MEAKTSNLVLIVDDNFIDKKLLQRILLNEGFRVHDAEDGESAVRLSRSGQYDAIIMDIGLPGIDGIEAAQKIRLGSSVPIIFLSSYADTEIVKKATRINFSDYLFKPVHDRQLLFSLNKFIGRGRNERQNSATSIEEFWQRLFDSSSEAIIVVNPSFEILQWNLSAERIYGYSANQVSGQNIFTLLEKRERKYSSVDEAVDCYQALVVDHFLKNSKKVRINSTAYFIGDCHSCQQRIVFINRHEDPGKQFFIDEKHLHAMISASNDAIAIVDRNYMYRVVNAVYAQKAGKEIDEIVDRSIAEVMGRKAFDALIKEKLDRCFDGETIEFDTWIDFPADGKRFVQVNYRPYKNESGAILGALVYVRDQTESELAKQSYEKSELRYKNLFKNVHDGIITFDEQGQILDCNPAAASISGFPEDLLMQKNLNEILLSDNFDIIASAIDYLKSEGALSGEFTLNRSELHRMIMEYRAGTLENEHCFFLIFREITEKKKILEYLQKSETQLQELFDNVPISLMLLDSNRRIQKSNRKVSIDTNRTQAELLNMRGGEAFRCIRALDSPEGCGHGPLCSACEIRRIVQQSLDQKESFYQREATLFVSDESNPQTVKLHLLVSTIPLVISKEDFVLVCIENISQLKEAEDKLKLSEQKYRSIVEDQIEMICRFLPDGTLTYVNKSYADYFNLSINDLVGKNFLNLMPESEREKAKKHLTSFSRKKNIATMEHKVYGESDQIHWHQWTDRAFYDDDGNLIKFQSVGRDITDRKNMELKLIENTKILSKSLTEKEMLLRELHHRVKNNFQVILSLIKIQVHFSQKHMEKKALYDLKDRIYAMSLVHELLYQWSDFSQIDMHYYVSNLFWQLNERYSNKDIFLQNEILDLKLDINAAIPLGLILNELFNIFLAEAASIQKKSCMLISAEWQDSSQLTISIKEHSMLFSMRDTHLDAMGRRLLDMLKKQLKSTINFENDHVQISFPLPP